MRFFVLLSSLIACGIFLSSACADIHPEDQRTRQPEKESRPVLPADTTIDLGGRLVTLMGSAGARGCILCLPGWNFSSTDVCEKSSFCTDALKAGYTLVLPEMGKSIYASAVFPESRKDWLKFPQLRFVTDTLIPYLQQHFNLLRYGQNNFVYGISTGGRGVGLVALHTDSLFRGGISLSGDFDQRLDTRDNLMRGWYGEYAQFTQRWELDNTRLHAAGIIIPLYLGHGTNDKVVPVEQSRKFYETLIQLGPGKGHELHLKDGGEHNYEFWSGETPAVLEFMRKHSR
jgi:pimeloyl-ACP methyl ester carboxylesterase